MRAEYKNIVYSADENITQIKFNRPQKLNAFTKSMWEEFTEAINQANTNNTKLIIIYGDDRSFSAGDDIPSMYNLNNNNEAYEFFATLEKTIYSLINTEKPLIGSVNGIAYGGGCEILMLMDIVIATKESKFALPEVRLGLIPPIALAVGYSVIGLKQVNRLALIGGAIDVFEAQRIGLVDYIVENHQLKDKTLEIAWKIIANDYSAINLIKKWSNKHKLQLQKEVNEVIKNLSDLSLNSSSKVRMQSFIEKEQEEISLFC